MSNRFFCANSIIFIKIDTISKNKLRTFLSGFTVAIGIFIFIILTGFGNGLTNTFQSFFGDDATNILRIFPSRTSKPYKGYKAKRRIELDNSDITDIKLNFPLYLEGITPRISRGAVVKYKNNSDNYQTRGVGPAHQAAEKTIMMKGRFINEDDIKKFLFSTRFLFQNLDRVIFFDNKLNLIGDTDTLDLDPRSFQKRLDIIELEILDQKKSDEITEKKNIDMGNDNAVSLKDILFNYVGSKNFGIPFTFTQEEFNKFKLTTIKNVMKNGQNVGYLAITENANDIKAAIDERKIFIFRTAIVVALVILIFSFVLNRYFLKPIKVLVNYRLYSLLQCPHYQPNILIIQLRLNYRNLCNYYYNLSKRNVIIYILKEFADLYNHTNPRFDQSLLHFY